MPTPQVVTFTQAQCERIAAAVKKVEGLPQSELPTTASYRYGVGVVLKGKLTSDLVYDEDEDPDTWTATFQVWYPEDPDDDEDEDEAQTDYDELTVWPWGLDSGTTIKEGTEVFVAWINGRWYVVDPSNNSLVRFELTSDLVYAEDAEEDNAVILDWDDDEEEYVQSENAITVVDFTNSDGYGTWSGKAGSEDNPGYQGWAVYDADREVYEIVWMETPARYIEFTLTAQLETSGGNATVNRFWDGRNPDPESEGIEVHDTITYWQNAPNGAMGRAIWDEKRNEYVIDTVQMKARFITGTISGTLSTGSQATCYVSAAWDGLNPGSTVNVQDIASKFSTSTSGKKYEATYCKENDIYYFTWVEC